MRKHTRKPIFSSFLNWESPTKWHLWQLNAYIFGRAALNWPLGSLSNAIFLVISEMLCIISLSLTRFTTCRSRSLAQSPSIASISYSSSSDEFRRPERSVSGNIILKVSLNVVTRSTFERCGGIRMFSSAFRTAFLVLAEDV